MDCLQPSTRSVLDRVLNELCETVGADAGILVSPAAPVEVWARCQRQPVVPPSTEHREPVLGDDGLTIGELRIVWRGRRVVSRSSKQSIRLAARFLGAACAGSQSEVESTEWGVGVAPVPLWVHDFTAVARWARERQSEGVVDIQAYLESVPDAATDCLRRVAVHHVNTAAMGLFGGRLGSGAGRDLPEFVVDLVDTGGCARIVESILLGEDRLETEISDGNGGRYTLLSRAARSASGHIDYSKVITTVSPLHTAIDPFEPSEQRGADGVVAEKLNFVAAMSHELRTPLTAVVGFAELLRDPRVELPEDERREMLETIYRQGLAVGSIVQDMMVLSLGDAGGVHLESRSMSVRSAVDQAISMLGDTASVAVSGPDVMIDGDPLRVRQVLRNLLVNAIEHGGAVRGVRIERTAWTVRVVVWDDGPPITKSLQEKMFRVFENGHTDHATPSGIGLGLTVCKRLLDAMGGRMGYSHDGLTSRFEIELPV